MSEARLGRVAVSDGTPDTAFRPDVDGVTYEIDATSSRVYAVGDFKNVNGSPANAVAVLDPANGTLVPGILPYVTTATNPDRQYQQTVMELGDDVWLGGSEHNTQAYNRSDFSLIKSYVTQNRGGDAQALATVDGIVYSGSHANAWVYWDTIVWPGINGFSLV